MNNKCAIVTGSGGGIGQGIAIELGKAGYNVVVHYNANISGAKRTCQQIEVAGGKAYPIQADLTKVCEVRRLFNEGVELLGGLDLYVNNSGITLKATFEETTEELFDNIVAVDFKSAYFCIQSAAKKMVETNTHGNIVVISSSNAFQQVPKVSVYGSIKTALCKLTRHAAAEYAKYNIRVNCIAPGWTSTPRTMADDVKATYSIIPLKRWVQPEEIGQMVLFYESPAAQSITGNIILADGGATLLANRAELYGL